MRLKLSTDKLYLRKYTCMKLSEPLLAELHHEAEKTKKYLEVIPTDSFGWKPHEKSMTLVRLATHIVELPSWLHYTLDAEELDFQKMDYTPPAITDQESLMKTFEDNLNIGIKSLINASDETFYGKWCLRNGDHIIFELPRVVVVRDMVFNHFVHHRGQLSVYLRLLNVKLPGIYGPSADEMEG
jgi:hypothetical protein